MTAAPKVTMFTVAQTLLEQILLEPIGLFKKCNVILEYDSEGEDKN